jgi:hypothetical protein
MSDSLPPWRVESVANIWNEYSRPLKLRQFSHGKGGTAARSAKRLTAILLDNAKLLEMSKHRDLEDLCDAFEATLQVALVAMAAQGLDAVNSSLGAQYTISMGFWQFTRPDISNICTIANQALGRTPEVQAADQQRRRDKAAAIKAFKHSVDDFIQRCVYRSGDDQTKLDAALNAAKQGLLRAEDLLR